MKRDLELATIVIILEERQNGACAAGSKTVRRVGD